MTQIVVPTLGESVAEATVAQWLKKEGDTVAVDEPIVELETDKVTLEVNATEAGVMSAIIVQEGENVEVGALLGEIGGSASNDSKPAAEAPGGGRPGGHCSVRVEAHAGGRRAGVRRPQASRLRVRGRAGSVPDGWPAVGCSGGGARGRCARAGGLRVGFDQR